MGGVRLLCCWVLSLSLGCAPGSRPSGKPRPYPAATSITELDAGNRSTAPSAAFTPSTPAGSSTSWVPPEDRWPFKLPQGEIRCGKATCRAGQMACCVCTFNDKKTAKSIEYCAPLTDFATKDPIEDAHKACIVRTDKDGGASSSKGRARCGTSIEYTDHSYLTCDDSTDCGTDGICCNQAQGSLNVTGYGCHGKGFKGDCTTSEKCHAGTCRTPRTSCVDGRCVVKNPGLDCAGKRCSPAAPYCGWVGGKYACVPRDMDLPFRIKEPRLFECLGPQHCGTNMRCCFTGLSFYSSRCAYQCDLPGETKACQKPADCESPLSRHLKVQYQCQPAPDQPVAPLGITLCVPGFP